MFQYLKKLAVGSFIFLIFVLPASAADTVQTKGGIASFYDSVTVGCITTHRFLLAADEDYLNNGSANEGRRILFLNEYDFDVCRDIEVRSAAGTKILEKYEILVNAASVRVVTTLNLSGTAGAEVRVVDLTWVGTGKPNTGTFVSHFSGPGYMVVNRFNGTSRSAAVSGSLGQEVVAVSGSIDFVKSGSVTIDYR